MRSNARRAHDSPSATILEDRRLAAPPRAPIAVGAPPQFGGSEEVWSPEELLVGAALECLWTTFEAYARHDQLEFSGWRGTGSGVLDKGPTAPVFTSITLGIEMTVAASDIERTRRILDTAEKHCIISNALRVAHCLRDLGAKRFSGRGSVTPKSQR